MPELLPFRGLRYARDDLDVVTAPPYDVIDDDERSVLAARHDRNAVRLILPEGPAATRYDDAASRLHAWEATGHLRPEPAPRLYGYRMEYTDDAGTPRVTTGVLGALRLPERAGEVLPHERTLSKAKSDRLALLRATRANLDPIWGLSLTEGLSTLVNGGEVLGECIDDQGVRHRITGIHDADSAAAIGRSVGATPLVLADGHHRFETAVAYRDERRAAGEARPGDDRILCLVVECTADQLWVQPIHRLVSGLPADYRLRAALEQTCRVRAVGPNTPDGVAALLAAMDAHRALGLVNPGGLALLVPNDEAHAVDAARFEAAVVPALPPSAQVEYRDNAATVAALVDKGAAQAAVLLRPVTVTQIHDTADAGDRMPQKTSFFAPKPRTGMVFRRLDLS